MCNVIKVKLDLCFIMTNLYTKFQVNISEDSRKGLEKYILAKGTHVKIGQTRQVELDL